MSFYEKYLKYKNKYLNLKIQIAGGYKTALAKLTSAIHDPLFKQHIMLDIELDAEIDAVKLFEKIKEYCLSVTDEQGERIFTDIRPSGDFKPDNYLENHIDYIINSYANNSFGPNNTLKNLNLYLKTFRQYNKLKSNLTSIKKIIRKNNPDIDVETIIIKDKIKIGDKEQIILNNLNELIRYMNEPEIIKLNAISEEIQLKKNMGKLTPAFSTESTLIYIPQNKEQAIHYGKQTTWCTAGDEDNMFLEYFKKGNLYIIISKNTSDKFQMHINEFELRNSENIQISFKELFHKIKDPEVEEYLSKLVFENIVLINNSLFIINNNRIEKIRYSRWGGNSKFDFFASFPNYKNYCKTVINDYSNIDELSLDDIIELEFFKPDTIKYITLGDSSMENKLKNSLSKYKNLEKLEYTGSYIFAPGDTFDGCIKLREIIYSTSVQLIDDIFSSCINLEELTLKTDDDINLGLRGCSKLIKLDLSTYNISDSFLVGCTELRELRLTVQTKRGITIGNALKECTKLNKLIIHGPYTKIAPLDDSLYECRELQILELPRRFNYPLDYALANCVQLQKITLGLTYDQPLGDSLMNCTALSELIIENPEYKYKLQDSIKFLDNLTKICIGDKCFDDVKNIDSFRPNII